MIEAFPEHQLFIDNSSGMRPFGQMVWEVIHVTGYALHGLMTDEWPDPVSGSDPPRNRQALLAAWDDLSERLELGLPIVPAGRYSEQKNLFWGPMTGFQLAIYQIDNEIHHRRQGYVYLRQLGIEPPPSGCAEGTDRRPSAGPLCGSAPGRRQHPPLTGKVGSQVRGMRAQYRSDRPAGPGGRGEFPSCFWTARWPIGLTASCSIQVRRGPLCRTSSTRPRTSLQPALRVKSLLAVRGVTEGGAGYRRPDRVARHRTMSTSRR
ncbi:DinB family protein (plasmid) [Deinococcus sp. KNUC1210]|uniref:DinB family protein n=1 Tax=Deinococcus sp. KNUC1210 TaxID=2917691 RepID=UPI001EEFE724|nr:DinB family protein [Deinococcus sp. KNUC1210]ULH13944.1 DinB family protein [Deinococcus sp. KNUC1210]